MLEEKSKIAEMMNEANNLYQGATRAKSFSMGPGSVDQLEMQNANAMEDLSKLIKPEYLDLMAQN